MNRTLITIATTAVVTLAIGYALLRTLKPVKERPEVAVSLQTIDGVCKVIDPVSLRQYKLKQVRWRVQNNCAANQFVQMVNFRQKNESDGTLGAPLVILSGPAETLVPAGGQETIRVDIARDVSLEETWKYVIAIGPTKENVQFRLDPDLEIWP